MARRRSSARRSIATLSVLRSSLPPRPSYSYAVSSVLQYAVLVVMEQDLTAYRSCSAVALVCRVVLSIQVRLVLKLDMTFHTPLFGQ
jgi:hypothetical protein